MNADVIETIRQKRNAIEAEKSAHEAQARAAGDRMSALDRALACLTEQVPQDDPTPPEPAPPVQQGVTEPVPLEPAPPVQQEVPEPAPAVRQQDPPKMRVQRSERRRAVLMALHTGPAGPLDLSRALGWTFKEVVKLVHAMMRDSLCFEDETWRIQLAPHGREQVEWVLNHSGDSPTGVRRCP
jgi:hypothetical protein